MMVMLNRISLRARILWTLIALIILSMAGGAVTIWSFRQIDDSLASIVNVDIEALNIAQDMEFSISKQQVLLADFFLHGGESRLEQARLHQQEFEECQRKARALARTDIERRILNDIESRVIRYTVSIEQMFDHQEAGRSQQGLGLHNEAGSQVSEILGSIEEYKREQRKSIERANADIAPRVRFIYLFALVTMPVALLLGSLLIYILLKQVLGPIRRLATNATDSRLDVPDEVKALSQRVSTLMEDVDQTQTELRLSREHLLQSEKLALVGKLAAGVAHSVRNPLTSVKMRLFSMQRSIDFSPTQKEDFDVISQEIRHIDTIVQNFLEFSRPPKLKIQSVSPSEVVDSAIQLLRHRIESYNVDVEIYRKRPLPLVEGDPEQLKEVLVNLVVNACEAMPGGGKITITEEEGRSEPMGQVAVIRMSDTGPGIQESIKEQVFQPFFSTKEEGTGLGLSIAARIVEDHKGCLNLRSRPGKGATFIITLPCRKDGSWLRSLS